jgi:excisionase family DNA binding protein
MTTGTRPAPAADARLLDVASAQARLGGIARSKLFELLAAGEIESTRLGRRRLIFADSLDAYVTRLRRRAPGAA